MGRKVSNGHSESTLAFDGGNITWSSPCRYLTYIKNVSVYFQESQYDIEGIYLNSSKYAFAPHDWVPMLFRENMRTLTRDLIQWIRLGSVAHFLDPSISEPHRFSSKPSRTTANILDVSSTLFCSIFTNTHKYTIPIRCSSSITFWFAALLYRAYQSITIPP